jgi:hypothetical protein
MRDYRPEIEKYCEDNNLSVQKVYSAGLSWNDKAGRVFIVSKGNPDPEMEGLGLLYDIPLPTALEIYLEDGKLRFVQTGHTYELLADCAPVPQMAFA